MAWKFDKKYTGENPMIGAHRGYCTAYPENTMIAFVEAAKLGVEMMEIDIQMSKDNVPMLFHDKTLDAKTTPLTGTIADYTYEELKQVRIGSKIGMEDQPLATLEEFCQKFLEYPDMIINVDMNKAELPDIPPVMEILEKYGYLDRVVFNSVNGDIIRYYKENSDYFLVGPPDGFYYVRNHYPGIQNEYDSVNVPVNLLTPEVADVIRSRGQEPMSCCIMNEEEAKLSIECGCTIALCDDPTVMLKMLGRM